MRANRRNQRSQHGQGNQGNLSSEHGRKSCHSAGTAGTPTWTPFIRTGQIIKPVTEGAPAGIVWANNRYIVVVRIQQPQHEREPDGPGELVWLSIKGVANEPLHDWRDFQRIKNDLVGEEVEAVELYPAESRLVDCANQYHLWCFPGFRFPFGFGTRAVSDTADFPRTRQRPLPPTSQQ